MVTISCPGRLLGGALRRSGLLYAPFSHAMEYPRFTQCCRSLSVLTVMAPLVRVKSKFPVKNAVCESLRRQHTAVLTVNLTLTLKSGFALMGCGSGWVAGRLLARALPTLPQRQTKTTTGIVAGDGKAPMLWSSFCQRCHHGSVFAWACVVWRVDCVVWRVEMKATWLGVNNVIISK